MIVRQFATESAKKILAQLVIIMIRFFSNAMNAVCVMVTKMILKWMAVGWFMERYAFSRIYLSLEILIMFASTTKVILAFK